MSGRSRTLVYCAAVLAVFVFVRGFKLEAAFLAQVDEVSTLNQTHLPFLTGGSLSSAYFPLSMLNKLVAGLVEFPVHRWFTFVAHLIGICLCCAFFEKRWGSAAAVKIGLLCTVHWYWNYIGRIYEPSSFTLFWGAIFLCCYLQGMRSGNKRSLFIAAISAGLGLSGYTAPWLYCIPAAGILLLRAAIGKSFTFGFLLQWLAVLLLSAAPFFYSLINAADLSGNVHYLFRLSDGSAITLPSVQTPSVFMLAFANTFGGLSLADSLPLTLWAAFLLVSLLAVEALPLNRFGPARQEAAPLAALILLQLAFAFLSPIPVTHPGHLALLLLSSMFLASLPGSNLLQRLVSGVWILSAVCFGIIFFRGEILPAQQNNLLRHALVEAASSGSNNAALSEGVLIKLTWSSLWKDTPYLKLPSFLCAAGISKEELERYEHLFVTTECADMINESRLFDEVWFMPQLYETHSKHGVHYFRRRMPPMPED